MMHDRRHRGERGTALLLALFALLLLSAIGLGMMYSANMETNVDANYRDKQMAVYGSLSGLQEARDRLQPSRGDIAAPNGLPSTSAANVIYIINPGSGETVAPWDYNHPYADTELCQENTLGLSGSLNVACSGSSSLPTGSSWYSTFDNSSSSYTGPYKLGSPLNFKWARITLKADNATPVAARGSASNGTQVCWDGIHQIPIPAGYGTNCGPSGSIASITLTSQGNGYTSVPALTIAAPPPGGVQATATAIVTSTPSGQVSGVTVTNGGTGYSSAPTVTLSGGGGSGATATATVVPSGSSVQSVSLSSTGSPPGCYGGPSAPTVAFSGGSGTGAAATAALTSSTTCIYSWTVSGSCSGYKNQTITVGASGGAGSGFSGSISFKGNGGVKTYAIDNPGTGYTSSPSGITGASGCTPTISWTLGYQVSSLTLSSGGAGYTSAPAVSIAAPPIGGTPTATATLGPAAANAGQIAAVTVASPGSGYTSPPAVTFSGGGGSGAVALASLGSTGKVTGVSITNPGAGYRTNPTVAFSGGGGSGAAATATIANGPWYGQVFLITSLAQTISGARAMSQMEAVTPVPGGLSVPGALTFDGPLPTYSAPNSNNFMVIGSDANSCGETAVPSKPAVGAYDDPNSPTNPSAVNTIKAAIPRPDHYIGAGPYPDVQNVFGSLGTMGTPAGLEALVNATTAVATHTYGTNPSIDLGSAANPVIDVVNGDVDLSGNSQGYGILLVRGTLTLSGNFSWNGVVFVIGQGVANMNGGGNGQITGMVFVAKTLDASGHQLSTVGAPQVNWNGGGGNGIQYDHCWADNLLARVPFTPPPSTLPLKVLSVRTVTY